MEIYKDCFERFHCRRTKYAIFENRQTASISGSLIFILGLKYVCLLILDHFVDSRIDTFLTNLLSVVFHQKFG